MAKKFQALGYTFETIDGKDNEVALCAVNPKATGKLIFPKNVEYNGENYEVSKIAPSFVPNSITPIGIFEYDHTASCSTHIDVTDVVVPSSVNEICDCAFYSSINLITVKLPEGLERIGNQAFAHCKMMASVVIPSTVKKIGHMAFYGCCKLVSIEIPSTVKEIWAMAFSKCSELASINIPPHLKIIKKETFNQCKALEKIVIPTAVELIDEFAFSGCDNLAQVDIYNDEGEVTIASNAFPANAKINYLGKRKTPKAAAPEMAANLSPKHTEEKKDTSPKPDKVKETAASQPAKKNEVSAPKPTKSVQEIKEEPNASSKLANEAQNDYKKSAEFEDYIINITEDKKVIVTKDGEVCEVTKVALREIAGKAGFNYDSEWTTQQFGRKLVAFLNEK
ncbi:MAG: leucine-rich repeat protein [Bacteroidales bacterium]|nr:leucine-rich repeat protein [Bacteroidales bacterium]